MCPLPSAPYSLPPSLCPLSSAPFPLPSSRCPLPSALQVTALYLACDTAQTQLALLLLEAGADPNCVARQVKLYTLAITVTLIGNPNDHDLCCRPTSPRTCTMCWATGLWREAPGDSLPSTVLQGLEGPWKHTFVRPFFVSI